jgi:H+/gluconate symporter-like permease
MPEFSDRVTPGLSREERDPHSYVAAALINHAASQGVSAPITAAIIQAQALDRVSEAIERSMNRLITALSIKAASGSAEHTEKGGFAIFSGDR